MTLFCAFKSLGNGAIAGSLETRLRAKLPNWTLLIGSSLPAVVFLRAMWQFGVLSVSLRSTWSTSTDPIKAVLLGLTIRVLCLARRYDVDDVIAAAWNGMLSTNLGRQKRSPARATPQQRKKTGLRRSLHKEASDQNSASKCESSGRCCRLFEFRVALNHCQTDVVAKRTTVCKVLQSGKEHH
jgi:hypothetical protein